MDVSIFEKLAFPVAMAVALLFILMCFAKWVFKEFSERVKDAHTQQKEDKDFLMSVIKEQGVIIAENTKALSNFSDTLKDLINVIKSSNKTN